MGAPKLPNPNMDIKAAVQPQTSQAPAAEAEAVVAVAVLDRRCDTIITMMIMRTKERIQYCTELYRTGDWYK